MTKLQVREKHKGYNLDGSFIRSWEMNMSSKKPIETTKHIIH